MTPGWRCSELRALAMSETERSNVIRALDLRHDEVLQSLATLEQQVELVIAAVRPSMAAETAVKPGDRNSSAA